jgi:hypothetical protein
VSLRVYLKNIEKNPEYRVSPGIGGASTYYYVGSIKIEIDDSDNYYYEMDDLEETIPPIFNNFVAEVSLFDFGRYAHREHGRYVHEEAHAIVDETRSSGLSIKVRGPTLDSVRSLYYLIRSGKILPEESWEDEQMSKKGQISKDDSDDLQVGDIVELDGVVGEIVEIKKVEEKGVMGVIKKFLKEHSIFKRER